MQLGRFLIQKYNLVSKSGHTPAAVCKILCEESWPHYPELKQLKRESYRFQTLGDSIMLNVSKPSGFILVYTPRPAAQCES